jgi:hypothetical protein
MPVVYTATAPGGSTIAYQDRKRWAWMLSVVWPLVPFIGIGGVSTSLQDASFNDTVGAGGVLMRWLAGDNWATELGWVQQFQTNDNLGTWTDWNLAKGLYAKLQYRF